MGGGACESVYCEEEEERGRVQGDQEEEGRQALSEKFSSAKELIRCRTSDQLNRTSTCYVCAHRPALLAFVFI